MVAPHLVLGATVRRADVEAFACIVATLGSDAKGYADEAACAGQRVRQRRTGDVNVDRSVVEVEIWDEGERVLVGAPVGAGQTDLQRLAALVVNRHDGHVVRPDSGRIIQR
jgi:hypothetical protein